MKDVVESFVRAGRLTYSSHANQRLKQRKITRPEVEQVLIHGHHEARKDQFNQEFNSWDYAFRGKTVEGRQFVVAIEAPNVLVVTAIDLDRED